MDQQNPLFIDDKSHEALIKSMSKEVSDKNGFCLVFYCC